MNKFIRLFFIVFLMIFTVSGVYSQETAEITSEPIRVNRDYIGLSVDSGNIMTLLEEQNITVLNSEGVKRFGNVIRFYDSDVSLMTVSKALIRKKDGKIINISGKNLTDTTFTPFKDSKIYNNIHVVAITYEGLAEGDTLEYAIINEYKKSLGAFWTTSYSMDKGFIDEGIVNIKLPAQVPLHYAMTFHNSAVPPSMKRENGNAVYTWTFKDVSPIKQEPAMPPSESLAPKVQISSFASWKELSDLILSFTEGKKTLSEKMKLDVKRASDGTYAEKIDKIYKLAFAGREVIDVPYGMGSYTFNNVSEVYESPIMTPYDSALLIHSLLEEAGIKSELVLAASLSMGSVDRSIASPLQFDSMLVVVRDKAGKDIWLDPSFKSGYINVISPELQGKDAFILSKEKPEFALLPASSAQKNREEVYGEVRLTEDGSAEAVLKLDFFGNSASLWKELYNKLTPEQRSVMPRIIAGRITEKVTPIESNTVFPKKETEPFSMFIRYLAFDLLRVSENEIECKMPVLSGGDVRKYLSGELHSRKYPVLIGSPMQEDRRFRIVIPKNLVVKSVPEDVYVTNKIGSYQVVCDYKPNGIYYYSRLVLKVSTVAPTDVHLLRDLLNASVKSREQKIILQRIQMDTLLKTDG